MTIWIDESENAMWAKEDAGDTAHPAKGKRWAVRVTIQCDIGDAARHAKGDAVFNQQQGRCGVIALPGECAGSCRVHLDALITFRWAFQYLRYQRGITRIDVDG